MGGIDPRLLVIDRGSSRFIASFDRQFSTTERSGCNHHGALPSNA
jgi:hypothetical protein